MPWLRAGDTSAMYPKLLSVVANANFDDRLINEVAGFLFRCATQSAGYITDYIVDIGTAYSIAPGRVPVLTDACVQAGLMEVVDMNGVRGWKIIEDPEFLHMKTEEEIAWEKQRKADNGNPALTIPIRLRDGDACRYCGKVVKWSARKGKLGATYDHRDPGQAGTVATMVVSCGECNAKRGNDPDADNRVPLLPPPSPPYYDKSTIEWINNSTWARDNGIPKLPPKKDKFVPVGSVPAGHESHIPVPTELLLESPVTNPAIQAEANGTGCESPAPDLPAWMSAAVPTTTNPAIQADVHVDMGDATDRTPATNLSVPSLSDQTATAVPGLESPADATPAPAIPAEGDGIADGGRESSGRAASQAATPAPKTPRPAAEPDLPKMSDPADRECAGSGLSGSGRDGTGMVGNGEGRDGDVSADGEQDRQGRKRRSRRRGKKKGR